MHLPWRHGPAVHAAVHRVQPTSAAATVPRALPPGAPPVAFRVERDLARRNPAPGISSHGAVAGGKPDQGLAAPRPARRAGRPGWTPVLVAGIRRLLWSVGVLGFGCGLVVRVSPTTQAATPLPPLPPALGVPRPGPTNDLPYQPQPILQGGLVLPLYPPDSPFLNRDRVREAEVYTLSRAVPGRIQTIVNIHNPSIEVHRVEGSLNTGSVIILVAGGGHTTLNVGTEGADFVSFFFNYGINTVILRNRLRRDGYSPKEDAVRDAFQAIRIVRAYADQWNFDTNRIGIMGFSAGAEVCSPTALFFGEFDRTNAAPTDPFAGVSSRPDFVGIVYPGPTPFARGASPPVPRNAPPAFLTCAGAGDRGHALLAIEYMQAMLQAGIPNVEMHIYGNGFHPGSGSTGGLTDRKNTPFGTWHLRFIEWFRDLGFLQPPGLETKAARDSAALGNEPTRVRGNGTGGPGRAEPR